LLGATHDTVRDEYIQSSSTVEAGMIPRKAVRPE
jgi:hypothetical protein